MFNFMNIDEIEFEEICKQILEKKTGKTFRVFGRGADGGIDIQANDDKRIIGQAKLYLRTSQADTINKIKKEIARIKNKDIEQYYIFIGREMSPQNIQIIYEELKPFLKSKEDIFTIKEINELLSMEEYSDIIRQHIKLWLCSTNILDQINNRNIFIDCEILLDNIQEDVKLFVQTELYKICQEILSKNRLLLILGMPGIGKTMLSKMLVLYYAQLGYSIRYTNSRNLEELKKSLSLDKEKRELIFLDDCLGQSYLELHEQRENDIINLIKYIKRYPNKMLLLNSRITIFQEAKSRQYELGKCIDNQNIQLHVIDIENITELEKARIFRHYLLEKQVPTEYIREILKDNNYMKIIRDDSYNPRIIDYMTEKKKYLNIKPQNYVKEILDAFKKSSFVWKDEFENRISLQDRIFLTTLFSISDYAVKEKILKKAFYERLKNEKIDTSIPIYETVLERLNQSFIKIIVNDKERYISVINPSVNDFIKEELKGNILEKTKILESATVIEQIAKIAESMEEYNKIIKQKIEKDEFLNFGTNDMNKIKEVYLAHIVYYDMLDKISKIDIVETILSLEYWYQIYKKYYTNKEIITKLVYSNVLSQKQIEELFFDGKNLLKILSHQDFSQKIEFLQYIYNKIENKKMKNESELIQYLENKFKEQPKMYGISHIAQEYGLDNIIANEIEELKREYEIDYTINEITEEEFKNELTRRVKNIFIEICVRYIQDILDEAYCELPNEIYDKMEYLEVGPWSLEDEEIDETVQKYISYVYNTYDEDYTYYRKYIYDSYLLDNEENIIHTLFKDTKK